MKNGRHSAATDTDVKEAKERYLAICFLQSVNDRYSSYLDHLRNSFLDGQEIFSLTLHQACNILQRRSMGATYNNQLEGGDGVAFTQESTNGRSKSHITCFQFGQMGHYANECATRNEHQTHGSNSMVVGMYFHFSQAASNIPATWILLDNQSTLDLFSNRNLLTNIRRSPTRMRVRCNAGWRSTNGWRPSRVWHCLV
jgi:hypothetical protein